MIGLVLTGGKSSRFGSDKAFYKLGNNFLWKRQYDLISSYCEQTVLACRKEQARAFRDQSCLLDDDTFQGPLHPIIQGFRVYQKDLLVLACDLAFIQAEDIKKLISHPASSIRLLSNMNGKHQPLAAIWPISCLKQLENYYDHGGRKVMQFVEEHGFEAIEVKANHLQNLNTPKDLNPDSEKAS